MSTMATRDLVKALRSQQGIDHAALTMALAILVERIQRLPDQDRDDLYELMKELPHADTCEDRESLVVAMLEILDQAPAQVQRLEEADEPELGNGLQKWIAFVSKKIRELRTKVGWTQERLAAVSGLPQSHISRLESGKHSPSRATLEKIAAALGVEVGVFDPSA